MVSAGVELVGYPLFFTFMSQSLSSAVQDCLHTATAKALATMGPAGINVVPVSMIKVTDHEIWLFDFFMEKTVENIKTTPNIALTAWTDMVGIQIKGEATYHSEGEIFDQGAAYVQAHNPDRVTKGVLIIAPTAVYDISPGGHFTKADLSLS